MFSSYDSALKWASEELHSTAYRGPSINRMAMKCVGKVNPLLDGLSEIERSNQAGNIVSIVSKIPDQAAADYLLAKYFYADKFDGLMMRVMAQIGGVMYRRAIHRMVLAYCGRSPISRRELRQLLQIRMESVKPYQWKVYDVLDTMHRHAVCEIESRLVDAGVVVFDERRVVGNG